MVKRKAETGASLLSLLPSLASRLASRNTTFFCGQEENTAYLLEMLERTVDKVGWRNVLIYNIGHLATW